jgi:uncharacterized protein (TIGR02246 family)
MKRLLIAAAVAASAPADAIATMSGEVCRRGEDVRTIRVVAPGTVGTACDVEVQRADGSISIPYNANADRNFCRAMAAELASKLTFDGFACSTAASEAVENSLAGGDAPAPAAVATVTSVAPARSASANAATPAAMPMQADLSGVVAEERAALPPTTTLVQPPPVRAAPGAPETVAGAPVSAVAPEEASFGPPVDLTAAARPIAIKAPAPPRSSGARRLVGVQPAPEDILDPLVVAEAAAPAPASGTVAATTPAPTPAAPPAAGEARLASPQPVGRPIDDLIRNVIAANVAAWNEGNLEAFMAGYAKDSDTTLTVDGEVVKGHSSVRKYFAKESADAGAMGRLALTDLDVSHTADDVVTVVGRYAVARASGQAKGATTIVMKRIDGRWRISHETRTRELALKD